MVPWAYIEFLDELTKLVNGGHIPMSRIDDAVRRVLRVKFSIGLFENPFAQEAVSAEFGSEVNPKDTKFCIIYIVFFKDIFI